MRPFFLIVAALLSACSMRLPAPEPTMAPPPPMHPDVAPPTAPAPKAHVPAPAPPKTAAKPPVVPKPTAAAPLDLKSLEQRLKDTNAIGVLTKLSLKNQVDDLVGRFREYHAGKRPPTLAELRQPFELLLMKVLALLQDKDTALAHDINASRDAIWGVLSDRDKLAQFT